MMLAHARSRFLHVQVAVLAASLLFPGDSARADDPKPTPANTIHVQLPAPVVPLKFARPVKFFISEVVDRTGDAQPLLAYQPRGGIFLDRLPAQVLQEALESSLKGAGLLAESADGADLLLSIYLFHFGLANSSGSDFFSKVDFTVTVKNGAGKTQQLQASGTSIGAGAIRKKNIQNNVEDSMEAALSDALRNLLRGQSLRGAVAAVSPPAETEAVPGPAVDAPVATPAENSPAASDTNEPR